MTEIRDPQKAVAKQHESGFKFLMIGQPITGNWIHKRTYATCINVMSPLAMIELLEKYQVTSGVRIINDFPIDYNRNKFVDEALEAGADYLMFMDMDQTFPGNTLPLLFEHISDEHPVVCGMYYLKRDPFTPVVGRYIDWTPDLLAKRAELDAQGFVKDDGTPEGKQLLMWRSITLFDKDAPFEVDVIGMGCVLVKAEVFRKLKRPYFRYSYDPVKGDPTWQKLSEDMYWCAQLKNAGIPILCDPRVQCGHLTEIESNCELYENTRDMTFEILKTRNPEKFESTMKEVIDVRDEQKRRRHGNEAQQVASA